MRRVTLFVAVILLVLSSFPVIEASEDIEGSTENEGRLSTDQGISPPRISPTTGTLTKHDPIIINNETDLKSQVVKKGWSGSGSEEDPFVIKDLEIDAEGNDSAIGIFNITSYILIFNCDLYNSSMADPGYLEGLVHLEDSSNITFLNCVVRDGFYGFRLEGFIYRLSIINSTIYDTYIGCINDRYSSTDICEEIEFNNCTFNDLVYDGIQLNHFSAISISDSYFEVDDDGICLWNGSDVLITGSSFKYCNDAIELEYTTNGNISLGYFNYCYSAISCYCCTSIDIEDIEAYWIRSKEIMIGNANHVRIFRVVSDSFGYNDGGFYLNYVENCTVNEFDIKGDYAEFYIHYCQNLQIMNGYLEHELHQRNIRVRFTSNSSFNNITMGGIKANVCENLTIENCNLNTTSQPSLELFQSSYMLFRNNDIRNEDYLHIVNSDYRSHYNTFFNNQFKGGFFSIKYGHSGTGEDYLGLRTQTIPPNNTIDGKPIRYFNGDDLRHQPIPEGSQFFFIDTSNITLSERVLDEGFNSPILGCRNLLFENVTTDQYQVDGLKILETENITITGMKITSQPNFGLIIDECNDIDIANSNFINGSWFDLMIMNSVDCRIRGCDVQEMAGLVNISNLVIIDNQIGDDIEIDNCYNARISENEIYGLQIEYSSNIFVEKNLITYYYDAISIEYSAEVEIRANDYNNTSSSEIGYGLYVGFSNKISIIDNEYSGVFYGIYSRNSNNVSLANITVWNSTYGMYSIFSSDLLFQDSVILDCEYGVHFVNTKDSMITSNIIKRCENHAITVIEDSTDNWIHDNAFLENNRATGDHYNYNTAQILDSSGDNRFHHLGRGNHYSEHISPDADFDGIVDEEYRFQGSNNSDPYPLVRTPLPTFDAPEITSIIPGDSIVTLEWTEPDVRIGESIEGYKIYMKKGEREFQIVYSGSFHQMMTVRNLGNGVEYKFMVSAFNEVGEGLFSTPVSAIPDGTGPDITFLSPERGSFLNKDSVTVEFDIRDNESGVESLNISIDGGKPISLEVRLMKYRINSLDEGPHSVKISSLNNIGLVSEAWLNFTIDMTPPIIIVEGSDIVFTNEDSILVNWETMEDPSGLENEYYLEMVLSGFQKTTRKESVIIPLPEDGEFVFTIMRVDGAHNLGRKEITIIKDTLKPSVIVTPEDGSIFNKKEIDLIWEMSGTGSPVSALEISIDRSIVSKHMEGPFTWMFQKDGTYLVSFFIMDAAGNINSTDVTYTIDTDAPKVQSFYPLGPDVPLDAEFFLTFDEVVRYVQLLVDGVPQTISIDGNSVRSIEDIDQYPGTFHRVTVIAEDLAGNWAEYDDFSFSVVDWGRATGRVVDTNGDLISGAYVEYYGHDIPCDENGIFEIRHQHMDESYPLIIKADGYEDMVVMANFSLGGVDSLGDIGMIPEEDSSYGSAALAFIIFLILILSLVCIAMLILVIVKKRRRGIDEDDMSTLKEIMSGFGIRRSPKEINCYSILGVGRRASLREVRKAYRDLASQYHPDRNIDKKEAKDLEEKMREINAAKTILMDPEKREVHDRMLDTYWG